MTPTQRAAMEQALEVLEQLQGGCTDSDDGTVEVITVWCPEVIDTLRAALAEQPAEQSAEPVAMAYYALTIIADSGYESTTEGRCTAGQYSAAIKALHNTAPQPAKRVQLTREELADAWLSVEHITHATERQIAFARAVIAAYEAKNGITGETK